MPAQQWILLFCPPQVSISVGDDDLVAQAVEARRAYWKEVPGVETVQLSKIDAKYSLNKSTSLSHL
jgi:hypothetical protein